MNNKPKCDSSGQPKIYPTKCSVKRDSTSQTVSKVVVVDFEGYVGKSCTHIYDLKNEEWIKIKNNLNVFGGGEMIRFTSLLFCLYLK